MCGKEGDRLREITRQRVREMRERSFASKQGKSNGKIKKQELKG